MTRSARTALRTAALVAISALALILAGCGDDGDDPAAGGSTATTATAPAAVPTSRIVGGQPEGGPVRIAGHVGDTLRFAVVSDTADELHVHGYDVLKELAPGRRVEVAIPADLEGIFEAELHGSGELVARLVVEP
ncbi:MAG: hypothetical protein QOD86_2432 [Miltoncostaeaceae bacterium]|nr:hypothetical protein [Miltoncostaeaceae bacterium]